MASISSVGIGSGLDLSGLIENLVNAERAPVQNTLDRQQNRFTTELSGVGIFRGAISSFQSSLSGLSDPDSYSTRSSSNTNSSALSASITNDAAVGSYNIDITNLAEKHSLASTSFASTDDIVGEGTLQIRFGTITGPGFTSFAPDANSTSQSIVIDSTNNTLSGLRDTINEGDFGVNASIINDGSGYRLTFESKVTGESSAMEISVTDTGDGIHDDNQGLSRLAFNTTTTQMTQTRAAEDAALIVNGIPVTSSSNTLSNMVDGVTLSLLEETAGTPLTLNISENTSEISNSIKSVVEAYNTMIGSLNDLNQAGPEGTEAGILVGDTVLRSFITNVRSQMTGTVDGLTGSITALSTIGIKTQLDGTLKIDDAEFSSAINENPAGAFALFAPIGQINDSGIALTDYTDNTVSGSYADNITQLATQSQLDGGTGLSLPITIDADNDNLTFKVDGLSTGTLSLTHGSYTTGADLAIELQLQINSASAIKDSDSSVSVSYDTTNNGFVITSNKYGSDSLVEVTSVDTNTTTELGFSVLSAGAGLDVAGTIGGNAASGDGQSLTSIGGGSNGLSIDVTGGAIGARDNIQFTRGLVENLNSLLSSYLDNDGILSAKEDGINGSLDQIAVDRENLERRIEALETRLLSQFTALDILVSQFQSTSDYLTGQLAALPGSGQLLNDN
jgi:flagellar hook-associated protein 2